MNSQRLKNESMAEHNLGQSAKIEMVATPHEGRQLADWPSLDSAKLGPACHGVALKLPKGCQKCFHRKSNPTPRIRFFCQMASARMNVYSYSFLRDKCRSTLGHWAASVFVTLPQGDTFWGSGFGSLCPLRDGGRFVTPRANAAVSSPTAGLLLRSRRCRARPASGRHAAARAPRCAPNAQSRTHGRMIP